MQKLAVGHYTIVLQSMNELICL